MNITLSTAFALLIPFLNEGGENEAPATPNENPSTSTYASLAPTHAVDDNTIHWKWKDGIRFETENGKIEGKLGGRIQADASFLDLDDSLAAFDDSDGVEFRRARLFMELAYHDYFMKAQYDFAGGAAATPEDDRPQIKDLYIGQKNVIGGADLKIGHYKEPFSLNELTSSKYLTFMERALPNTFTPGRNTGISLYDTAADDNVSWAVGVFKQATDDAGFAAEDGGYAVTARITGTPVYEDDGDTLVHVGVGYSMRDNAGARFRARPEVHISDRLVDTGTLDSDSVDLGNVELAAVLGPVHASAEYLMAEVSGSSGNPDGDFDGYYAELGYFLTGETRPYKRSSGSWARVKPGKNTTSDGSGALEAAIRYSSVNLTDGAILGGEEDNITLAFNWYLSPNMRVAVNYVTGSVDLGPGLTDEDVQALLFRFQVDW